ATGEDAPSGVYGDALVQPVAVRSRRRRSSIRVNRPRPRTSEDAIQSCSVDLVRKGIPILQDASLGPRIDQNVHGGNLRSLNLGIVPSHVIGRQGEELVHSNLARHFQRLWNLVDVVLEGDKAPCDGWSLPAQASPGLDQLAQIAQRHIQPALAAK